MDPSPCNMIITEHYAGKKAYQECPHHIVKDAVSILKREIDQNKNDGENPALQQNQDNQKILKTQHQEIMAAINAMKEEIKEMKLKMSSNSTP